jgi:fructan beta-fructosidase
MKNILFILSFFVTVIASAQRANYKEKFRPQFHFSPAVNWANDPNGLLYFDHQYHLFYQSNPFGNVWGHMSWSHATSSDLLHWKDLPPAIKEENGIMIFSGTCVADKNNTAGFAKNAETPLVVVYTGNSTNLQTQNIAYSTDSGITWTKYAGNPILDVHEKDFRDPKIFWYAVKKYWVMALMLSVKHKVEFYKSNNLKHWDLLSEFGPAGDTSGVWECPDLFKVCNKKKTYSKWVLTLSVNGAMQYFVGSFDGVQFKNENDSAKVFRPDYGPDYYAAISYNNLPFAEMPVMIGWINNWKYANDIPTIPWKGAMSLPRRINITRVGNNYILLQHPVEAFNSLRSEIFHFSETIADTSFQLNTKCTQLEMDVDMQPSANNICGVKLAIGNNHFAEIGYDAAKKILYMDRSHCANQDFNPNFKNLSHFETPLSPHNDHIRLQIYFDNSIIEVFANDGEKVMTMQVFPADGDNGLSLFSKNGVCNFSNITFWKMRSVWEK